MKRELLCPACASRYNLHPQDVSDGFRMRKLEVQAQRPPNHGYTINGEFVPLGMLVCDHCDLEIKNGEQACCATSWCVHREGEPGPWETEYTNTNTNEKPV